jgi:hypothetical protein
MKNLTNRRKSYFSSGNSWWRTTALAVFLMLALPAAASAAPLSQATINTLALHAYCSEAESHSLASGSISYKRVAELASHRALAEHPNVYRDSFAWKNKIVGILDQYGDEPTSQLCKENPGAQS